MSVAQAGINRSASDKKEVFYHRSLWRLMAFMGGYEPEAELLEFKSKDVAQFMKQEAYHTRNPEPNDRPTFAAKYYTADSSAEQQTGRAYTTNCGAVWFSSFTSAVTT
jgi:hypothetical protein